MKELHSKLEGLLGSNDKEVAIFLDNARIHKSIRSFNMMEDLGLNIVFPSPYSPETNYAEKIIKRHKGVLKMLAK